MSIEKLQARLATLKELLNYVGHPYGMGDIIGAEVIYELIEKTEAELLSVQPELEGEEQ